MSGFGYSFWWRVDWTNTDITVELKYGLGTRPNYRLVRDYYPIGSVGAWNGQANGQHEMEVPSGDQYMWLRLRSRLASGGVVESDPIVLYLFHDYVWNTNITWAPTSAEPGSEIYIGWNVHGGYYCPSEMERYEYTLLERRDAAGIITRHAHSEGRALPACWGGEYTQATVPGPAGFYDIAYRSVAMPREHPALPEVVSPWVTVKSALLKSTSALPRDSAIEVSWTATQKYVGITGFRVLREQSGSWVQVAEIGPETRSIVDSAPDNVGAYRYKLEVLAGQEVVASAETPAASPSSTLNAESLLEVTSGTPGSNGWYKTPVTFRADADGPIVQGSYQGVNTAWLRRNFADHGDIRFADEFETTAGWLSSGSPVSSPQLSADANVLKQGFASMSAVVPNDATSPTDTWPKITKTFDVSLSGLDTVELWAHYDTTFVGSTKGTMDILLYDGPDIVFSVLDYELARNWNAIALPLGAASGHHISKIEFVLHEAHKGATPPSAEIQTFKLDSLRFTTASELREAEDGIHVWNARIRDLQGAEQETLHQTFKIDTAAPMTTDSLAGTIGAANYFRSPVTVTLPASDTTSGVSTTKYKVDGTGQDRTYTGPFEVGLQGFHFIDYWSVDKAGNPEIAKRRGFYVDSAAPVTTFSASGTGSSGWYSGEVTVTIQRSDATSGVLGSFYNVDGGPWIAAGRLDGSASAPPITLKISGSGGHTVSAYTMDQAGNVEAVKSTSFTIDNVPPQVTSRSPVPDGVATSRSDVVAQHNDLAGSPSSGVDASRSTIKIERSLTGPSGPWTDITGQGQTTRTGSETRWHPTSLGGLQAATYRVTGTIYDLAGNSATLEPSSGWLFTVPLNLRGTEDSCQTPGLRKLRSTPRSSRPP